MTMAFGGRAALDPGSIPRLPSHELGRSGRTHSLGPVAAVALGAAVLAGLLGGSAPAGAKSTTSTSSATRSESARVIHAPIGYELDTQPGFTNGPVSPAAFDTWVGAGSTTSFGFVDGYDVTYASTATNESIEVTLFRFHSPAGAAAFTNAAVTQWGASSLSPEGKTIRAIQGSTVQVGTKTGSDGFYLVDAFARKGDTMMVIEYANDSKPNGVPRALKSAAVSQYARL